MFPTCTRVLVTGLLLAAMGVGAAGPAAAQVPALPDLPDAPLGTVGEILDPVEDLIADITGPLGDALGDVPLDNAVSLLGEDAVDAAVALSRITFETSDIAFIGRDDVFADTLSSIAGQGIAGAPLLLTQTDAIDARTAEELARLGVTRVILLGAESALSPFVQQRFETAYGSTNVSRIGGATRIETAAALATELSPDADHVILLRAYPEDGAEESQAYADALSAGPLASSLELPSLLTTSDALHPATAAYLESADVQRVTLIGGESAVTPAVEQTLTDLGMQVDRIAGDNRWATSILVAGALGVLDASEANRILLTEGGSADRPLWSAGFAAAAHGAVFSSPVILADGPLLPPETLTFFVDGLVANALRLSNEPLICNSFVDIVACETAALLMVGLLDEANALTGGALGELLGPALEPLAETLEETVPAVGDISPALADEVAGLVGLASTGGSLCSNGIDDDGDGSIDEADECEAAFTAAMATQPPVVRSAVDGLVGTSGQRVQASRQGVLTDVLAGIRTALGGGVMTADPAQAQSLATLLDAVASVLGSHDGQAPIADLTALLQSVEALVDDLADVAALGAAVADLGTSGSGAVEELTDTVGDLLSGGPAFQSSAALVETHGEQAQPLAGTVDRLAGR